MNNVKLTTNQSVPDDCDDDDDDDDDDDIDLFCARYICLRLLICVQHSRFSGTFLYTRRFVYAMFQFPSAWLLLLCVLVVRSPWWLA